ncbi:hypothetical protein VKI21_05035 [Cyanobacterium aponinum UTEX 3222]|uniref:hypothetical protein n=1 Tax=Cyanobacterium aponinum TaxID=379064 RepID=UPI002B4BBA0F|nr:hypothetical protein [Cyanobacterium aponinum]WRL40156.1 hypothetical protein VKI22_08785 [Cyanobacterium aponinum UTEX 3221]WRL43050.1 hypothetical protein VKI21_05035 [Cyanobacterium aponinum UTEX 3222]
MSKIFIETRGTSEVYNWFDALESNKKQLPQLPELVKKLADTEFESLVLYRESRQLILAITALKSGRIDNRTRPIRNSLIWIVDNDEEAKIRAIIYEYLTAKDGLEKDIADAITETPEIKIDYQKIESIGNNNLESNALNSARLIYKIGNLDKYKQELIDEIKSCSLPKEKGLLVFITNSKSQNTFEEAKPWRGLSNEIKNKGWISIQKKSQTSTSMKSGQNSLTTQKNQSNLWSIILLIVLVISNIFWVYQNNQLNERINELEKKINQIENLQSVIGKSKADVERITTNLETDINTAKDKFEKLFMEAQKQFNDDIFKATSKYETEMAKVQQRLNDSIKKLN